MKIQINKRRVYFYLLTVEFKGSREKLADAVSEAEFVALKASIVGLSGNKIEISIGR